MGLARIGCLLLAVIIALIILFVGVTVEGYAHKVSFDEMKDLLRRTAAFGDKETTRTTINVLQQLWDDTPAYQQDLLQNEGMKWWQHVRQSD